MGGLLSGVLSIIHKLWTHTVLNVPLVKLCRELLLEPFDVQFDALNMHTLLRWPNRFLIAERGEIPEVAVHLRERERMLKVAILTYIKSISIGNR